VCCSISSHPLPLSSLPPPPPSSLPCFFFSSPDWSRPIESSCRSMRLNYTSWRDWYRVQLLLHGVKWPWLLSNVRRVGLHRRGGGGRFGAQAETMGFQIYTLGKIILYVMYHNIFQWLSHLSCLLFFCFSRSSLFLPLLLSSHLHLRASLFFLLLLLSQYHCLLSRFYSCFFVVLAVPSFGQPTGGKARLTEGCSFRRQRWSKVPHLEIEINYL